MRKFYRNSIRMTIAGKDINPGCSKFGGQPEVPADFQWPYYEGETFDGIKKNRPLSFLAQLNCAEFAKYDTEQKLPQTGMRRSGLPGKLCARTGNIRLPEP